MESRTPSLVVHASAFDVLGGSRSLDSVVDAMNWAAAHYDIGGWHLELAGPSPRDLPARIAASGGSLASSAGGSRTITVPPDVVLCGASIVRLLRAAEHQVVKARSVVLAGADCVAAPSPEVRREPEILPSAPISRLRAATRISVQSTASLLELVVPPEIPVARKEVSDALQPDGDLLLSVIMRTQGKRPEATRDTLLSLAAQTDGRFELILVGHGIKDEAVAELFSDQPRWLRHRTRVVAVGEGGTRSRPLNRGLAEARGSHVAVLDDDDLVLPEWVGAFLETAHSSPARLLRAQVLAQPVRAVEWVGGFAGHQDDGEVSTYPARYDLADHLRVNLTPFMAFAFPRSWLNLRGGADEQLEVCEDWDLSLRAAGELGVLDLPVQTAVYRRWVSGGDSYTQHASEVWRRDMRRVLDKADARTLVMGPGSARRLAQLSVDGERSRELTGIYAGASWRITAPLRWVRRWLRQLDRRPG